MKIRTDFVTNSSSSSFVSVRIKSEKLLDLLEKNDVRSWATDSDNNIIYEDEDISGRSSSYYTLEALMDWFIEELLESVNPGNGFVNEYKENRKIYLDDISDAHYTIEVSNWGEFEEGDESDNWRDSFVYVKGNTVYSDDKRDILGTNITDNFVIDDGVLIKYNGDEEEIEIPYGVTTISEEAFEDCDNIMSITFPSSITKIEHAAFEGCTDLAEVYFRDWKSFLGMDDENENEERTWGEADVYINGEKITDKIVIPEGVTRIGEKVFYHWTITSITIPDSVTSIGFCAFFGCAGLKSITIPESVVSIGEYAFDECEDLECVCFSDLNSFFDIEFYDFRGEAGYVPGWKGVDYYINGELVKGMVVPDGITNITGIFYGCKSIESITIPASVTTMAEEGFYYCDNLKSIYFNDLDSFLNIDRIPATFGSNLNVDYYIDGKLLTELTIPEGVTKIGKDAFAGCKSLESVTISDSVTSIEEEAFCACRSLNRIMIPDSVTSIDWSAFDKCTNLTIHASSGSYAEEYAKEKNIPFEAID